MGRIITLQDGLYSYEEPINEPNNERDILNHQFKKDDQFWRTPPIIDVKKISVKERIEYIEKERQRWSEGVFILVKGELKYMPGLMYEHLTLNTYNSGKLMYFDDERFIFYFIDLTENDKTCTGRTWIKPRRAKMTTIMCSLAQRKLLSDFSNYITIQSDTLDKAQKSYMSPIIDSYVRRPLWARELYYAPNGKKPRKALELTSNVIQEEGEEWMGGKVNIFPTVAKAIDGLEAVECIIDEFSKIEDTIPYEMYEIARKVIQNFRKEGKTDCLSSSGDSKDAVKATMDWHKLIANSNPLNKDPFGKTVSGSWEFFISAIHSQYVPKEFTDKFGIVNKEKAEEWVWNEIKKYPEGTREYIYALYKLPLKKEHALLSSAISNLFGKIRISSRLTKLESLLPDQKPYIRGILTEPDQKGRVWFEPDSTGLWLWAVQPYYSVERNLDLRNRCRTINDVYFPPLKIEGVIGYDPVNTSKINLKSNNYSQACLFIRKKFDYYNTGVVDEVMAMYLGRPEDPRDVNKEAMKACKYTGFVCNHEKSVNHVYEDFRDNNMLPFLMMWDGVYGMSPSRKTTKDGVSMLQTRYAPPKTSDDKDQIECYPFEDGLRSLDNFDESDTTPFDPTMAEIYTEHGLKTLVYSNVSDNSNVNKQRVINEIFPPVN